MENLTYKTLRDACDKNWLDNFNIAVGDIVNVEVRQANGLKKPISLTINNICYNAPENEYSYVALNIPMNDMQKPMVTSFELSKLFKEVQVSSECISCKLYINDGKVIPVKIDTIPISHFLAINTTVGEGSIICLPTNITSQRTILSARDKDGGFDIKVDDRNIIFETDDNSAAICPYIRNHVFKLVITPHKDYANIDIVIDGLDLCIVAVRFDRSISMTNIMVGVGVEVYVYRRSC